MTSVLETIKAQVDAMSPEQIREHLLKVKAQKDKERAYAQNPEVKARAKEKERVKREEKKAFMQRLLERSTELGLVVDGKIVDTPVSTKPPKK